LVVRIGEKKILQKYREKVSEMIKIMEVPQARKPAGGGKRKADRDAGENRKKRREMR
jgi:hypothetical protein